MNVFTNNKTKSTHLVLDSFFNKIQLGSFCYCKSLHLCDNKAEHWRQFSVSVRWTFTGEHVKQKSDVNGTRYFRSEARCYNHQKYQRWIPALTLFAHQDKNIFCLQPHLAAGTETFRRISARFFPGIISCGEPPACSLIQFAVFPWHVSWHVSLSGFRRCQDVEEQTAAELMEASAADLKEKRRWKMAGQRQHANDVDY